VKGKGSFLGIIEKIPYLKKLGITALELQPAYEFLELEEQEEQEGREGQEERLNYWGYKRAYYYAPKNAYACCENPVEEFKDMVKALHRNNMEVIMQFFFPSEIPGYEILEIIRYWKLTYHVDGFHFLGQGIPSELIAADPLLSECKLFFEHINTELLPKRPENENRNVALYREDYKNLMRCFLKGDEGILMSAVSAIKNNPAQIGYVNFFSNYSGFTLQDMVAYENKHNEDNGEQNQDGSNENHSWNCGIEGNSRKKKVNDLRGKQVKNALALLFLSQATPLIFMGDEFGNSQKGNNNPYCQDNDTTWLNWKDLTKNQERYDFTAKLIAFRKKYKILHMRNEMSLMDSLSCGYPDLSFHGEESWHPKFDYNKHHVGLLYCGKYEKVEIEDKKKRKSKPFMLQQMLTETFIYIGINMHWETQALSIPKLPKGQKWKLVFATDDKGIENVELENKELENKELENKEVENLEVAGGALLVENRKTKKWLLSPRSIALFVSEIIENRV
ncbi:alpha-amylase, partial [Lachnospiraceae bacterium OttesenSCG-928-D06]|nr:alpha-amylase [Lachnospiraceae bacterium OttesenSCG-928-D06]